MGSIVHGSWIEAFLFWLGSKLILKPINFFRRFFLLPRHFIANSEKMYCSQNNPWPNRRYMSVLSNQDIFCFLWILRAEIWGFQGRECYGEGSVMWRPVVWQMGNNISEELPVPIMRVEMETAGTYLPDRTAWIPVYRTLSKKFTMVLTGTHRWTFFWESSILSIFSRCVLLKLILMLSHRLRLNIPNLFLSSFWT